MTKPIILLGGGGHAKVLIELLHRLDYPLLGLLDPHYPIGESLLGATILGDDSVLAAYDANVIELVNGIGSLPHDSDLRRKLFNAFSAKGYAFKTLRHPTAIISPSATLMAGVQIMAGVIIQASATIAENSLINSGAIIEHDCRIGRHVHIAPGAVLSGTVTVGNAVHIGTGAIIIQGITIGEGSIIGAGSVITHDVAPQQIVYPARPQYQAINRDQP